MRISTLISSFASLTYLLADAAATSAFSVGTIVRIDGIQSNINLNGSYAIVLKSKDQISPGRSAVMALLGEKVSSFNPGSGKDFSQADYFSRISVKNENLHIFEWNSPVELSFEEILNNMSRGLISSSFSAQEITAENQAVLDRVAQLLWKLCSGNPGLFLDSGINEFRAKLIGAWIIQNYHFTAMQYVADKNRDMTEYLARAWNGISVWQA